ncbi:Ribosome maturation factor RimP [Candidatus Kinetoplastibacterium sorsogonicusi]|uniref:Ribosome maturation factor RimP n=1 Tax=Candidatus Kinetoplastidibacterium kentomonadis TaxID=1576550 RepID=A0A3S7JA23_9PROT|nr:ribosome maturation factor RimP [Candidatus Kinetoplastibacterium sorsogonicusi]AWD32514.1 Ribosome maturation factor RimP [Candidatus Kinetoplastibacterium sorsogonicusi]
MVDLFKLVNNVLVNTDIELVDIERSANGLLRVIIDKPCGIQINDCELVTRDLMRVLEVYKVDYNRLEVTSPGIDRSLKKESDFLKFIGHRIEIKFHEPINGCKNYLGILYLINSNPEDINEGIDCNYQNNIIFGLEVENKKEKSNIINFTFNCVDRAKLAPILDFKGKKDESRDSSTCRCFST